MFRKPRDDVAAAGSSIESSPILPSTGRPPTPPIIGQELPRSNNMASTSTLPTTTPLLGRSRTVAKKAPASSGKVKSPSNGNIMNFFKKAESQSKREDEPLFIDSAADPENHITPQQMPTPPRNSFSSTSPGLIDLASVSPLSRFNEDEGPVKRRKTDAEPEQEHEDRHSPRSEARKGPFFDDSDEDDEPPQELTSGQGEQGNDSLEDSTGQITTVNSEHKILPQQQDHPANIPPVKHESTSMENIDEFDGIEDFIDDEFAEEGEELIERRLMEEQARIEAEIEDQDEDQREDVNVAEQLEACTTVLPTDASTSTCPICGGPTSGMSEQDISVHVNDCLDGKAKPLSNTNIKPKPPSNQTQKPNDPISGYKRFQRAAIARPGQDNPFSLTESSAPKSSAFSKLMSGHAEDNAWATAAATEAASRGKPAYQRTCPFYKIMPGFSICVDAFRYGAVEGCNAYFLSHFHSDHYIGLTSSWCHGPIYCSHVTANLVRRQLRVDPKWVIDLESEKKVEVPNTQGVEVTMIPANHCPGSSLYLFEKAIGKGKNPKVQRVLHCGDFRACPAHVQHQKLRPEFLDHVTGKLAHQKIDVCYLDTTYLTPKYAFPSQETVIKACAEMCVSLSKDFIDENDSWEQVKKERAGDGMVKFVQKATIKDEPEDVKVKIEDEPESTNRSRGRLLVIIGTYSIGKERICLGVAKALRSKIYAPPGKQKVVAALEDPELSALMTDDPYDAQVHMQMLMEIRAETLADYLTGFKPRFSRIVGFRPSGWNYRPPSGRLTDSPSVQTVLHSSNWKSTFTMHDLVPQRGSTREANCFGVPYSEHSSFRELTMFCCALRIDKIIPTVNVGSAKSREKMKGWIEKWAMEKKKSGLYKVTDDQVEW